MSELYRITVSPEQCSGRPCIRGLRIRVKDILDLLAAGASRDEVLEDYPYLEQGDITAALEFAARQTDHPVLSVADLSMSSALDGAIQQLAARKGAVILTKDEDFAIWRVDRAGDKPAVVWLRVGNTRRRELLRWFEPLLPQIIAKLDRGEMLIEVR